MAGNDSQVNVNANDNSINANANVNLNTSIPNNQVQRQNSGDKTSPVPSITDVQSKQAQKDDLNRPAPKPKKSSNKEEKTIEILSKISETLTSLQDSTINMKTEIVESLDRISLSAGGDIFDNREVYISTITDALVESFADRNMQMNLTDSIVNTIYDTKFQSEFIKVMKESLNSTITNSDYFINNSEKSVNPKDTKELMEGMAEALAESKDFQDIDENSIFPVETINNLSEVIEKLKEKFTEVLNEKSDDNEQNELNELVKDTLSSMKEFKDTTSDTLSNMKEHFKETVADIAIRDKEGEKSSPDKEIGQVEPEASLSDQDADKSIKEEEGIVETTLDQGDKINEVSEQIAKEASLPDENDVEKPGPIPEIVEENPEKTNEKESKESDETGKQSEETPNDETKNGDGKLNSKQLLNEIGKKIDKINDVLDSKKSSGKGDTDVNGSEVLGKLDITYDKISKPEEGEESVETPQETGGEDKQGADDKSKPIKNQIRLSDSNRGFDEGQGAVKNAGIGKLKPKNAKERGLKPRILRMVTSIKNTIPRPNAKEKGRKNKILDTGLAVAQHGTKAVGTVAGGIGKAAKVVGTGLNVIGKAGKFAGKGVSLAGKGLGFAGEKIGGALSYAIPKVGPIIGKVIGGAIQGVGKGVEFGGKGLEKTGNVVDKAGNATKKFGRGMERVQKSVNSAATRISKTRNALANNKEGGARANNTTMKQLNQVTTGQTKDSKSSGGILSGLFNGGIVTALNKILASLNAFSALYKTTTQAAAKEKMFNKKFGTPKINEAKASPLAPLKKAGAGIKNLGKIILGSITGAFTKLKLMIIGGLIALGAIIWMWVQKKFGGDWVKFFKWIWEKMWAITKWLWNWIIKIVGAFLSWIGEKLANMFRAIGKWYVGLWVKLWSSIANVFKKLWNNITKGFKNLFSGIWNGIKNFFKKIIDGFKNLFNPKKLLDKLPAAVKKFIPGFATGGRVEGGPEKGDKILIRANAGEYVFNKEQMDRLGQLLSKNIPGQSTKKLTHEQIFRLANTSGKNVSEVQRILKKGEFQRFAEGGRIQPERRIVEKGGTDKIIIETIAPTTSNADYANNLNNLSENISNASLKLDHSSGLLIKSAENSKNITNNVNLQTSNTLSTAKNDLSKSIQTNIGKQANAIDAASKARESEKKKGFFGNMMSKVSNKLFKFTPAGILTEGIAVWWEKHKEMAIAIKNDQQTLLNKTLQINSPSGKNDKELNIKASIAQANKNNISLISNLNSKINEVTAEKKNTERQNAELYKKLEENKYEALTPIIANAIRLYFDSRKFKLDAGVIKLEEDPMNSSASRL
jgi:hypothetical protein